MISVQNNNEAVLASAQPQSLGISILSVAPATVEVTLDMLLLGGIAGTGAFSEVFRVKYLGGDDPVAGSSSTHEMCGCFNTLPRDMAMKRLKYKILVSSLKKRRSAASDLLAEAKALSSLSPHENIVCLYAVSNGFWDRPSTGFLLLEAVDETLDERLEKIHYPNGSHAVSPFRYHKRQRLLRETQCVRIQDYGLGIARALRFVHKNGMVYGDLKPTNIGIKWSDEGRPTVKLCDFGLVRPCTEQDSGISEASGSKFIQTRPPFSVFPDLSKSPTHTSCSPQIYGTRSCPRVGPRTFVGRPFVCHGSVANLYPGKALHRCRDYPVSPPTPSEGEEAPPAASHPI
jgi:serine/threonine protein kinase